MLAVFISDELIASILQPFGNEFVKYIEEHGSELLQPEIEEQIVSFETESMADL